MLDIKQLRQNPHEIQTALAKRGFDFNVQQWETLEHTRAQLQQTVENLQAQRNTLSKQIAQQHNTQDTEQIKTQVKTINARLTTDKKTLEHIETKIQKWLLELPNIPHQNCPQGQNETHNITIKTTGTPTPFNFTPRDHITLGKMHGGLDLEAATHITGSRFMVLHGAWAKLHRVLATLMLDTHVQDHYEEVYVPYLVNENSLIGTGQLPKFKEDLFETHLGDKKTPYFLIPTAEVPVTNLLKNQILPPGTCKQFVCHSPCFRSEAGAYGKDTKGIIRQHQFDKVELVHIVPESQKEHTLTQLLAQAEKILQLLEIPYIIKDLCAGDLGFSAERTFDIEAWIPSQNTYREISSCSSFGTFQARRLQIRSKNPNTGKKQHLCTLNGSALAVGRTLVALVENFQTQNGQIKLPKILAEKMQCTTLHPLTP